MKKNISLQAFIHALAELVYISLVALFMINGEHWFNFKTGSITGPMTVLLLFVISALISGILILGKPAILFLEGSKKEAIKMLLTTLAFLVVFLGIVLMILL